MSEEIYPDLNEEDNARMDEIMDEHWRNVAEEGDDNNNIHALRREVYVKEKGGFINREFLVSVTH